MANFWRILTKLAVYFGIILVTLAGLGYWLVTKSHPQKTGTLHVPMLQSPVEVFRDSLGVPHIFT